MTGSHVMGFLKQFENLSSYDCADLEDYGVELLPPSGPDDKVIKHASAPAVSEQQQQDEVPDVSTNGNKGQFNKSCDMCGSKDAKTLALDGALSTALVVAQKPGELFLRGQKVSTTLRGKPVPDARSDHAVHLMLNRGKDGEKHAAEAKTIQAFERASELKQYQEKKLLEKIEILEQMKEAEKRYQDELKKRDARRVARNEGLKQQINDSWAKKMEEERKEQEQLVLKKEQEAVSEQRNKKYHEKKKQELERWYAESAEEDCASKVERAKAKRETQWFDQITALQEKKQSRLKTVKVALAEERATQMQMVLEERPPRPPRGHDRTGPSSGALTSRPTAPRSSSWTREAKLVSTMYGLSPREHAVVEGNLVVGVHGAGRMAAYEKPKGTTK